MWESDEQCDIGKIKAEQISWETKQMQCFHLELMYNPFKELTSCYAALQLVKIQLHLSLILAQYGKLKHMYSTYLPVVKLNAFRETMPPPVWGH